jgi:hypothetical protein
MRSGWCPQRRTQPPALFEVLTSLPVLVALILPLAVAFTSPLDQLFMAGIYDAADRDDIVTPVNETAGVAAVSMRPVPLLPRSSEMLLV